MTGDQDRRLHTDGKPVRRLSVEASGLAPADSIVQLSLFPKMQKAQRRAGIDRTLDKIRRKYGYHSIRRSIAPVDPAWTWIPKRSISSIPLL